VAKDGHQDEGAFETLKGALGIIALREGFVFFCKMNKRMHNIKVACDESAVEVCEA
jgi:hypothetical protein